MPIEMIQPRTYTRLKWKARKLALASADLQRKAGPKLNRCSGARVLINEKWKVKNELIKQL
jgi:hypothetical protein